MSKYRGMMAEEIMQPAACPGQWALLVGETPTLRCCSSGAPDLTKCPNHKGIYETTAPHAPSGLIWPSSMNYFYFLLEGSELNQDRILTPSLSVNSQLKRSLRRKKVQTVCSTMPLYIAIEPERNDTAKSSVKISQHYLPS